MVANLLALIRVTVTTFCSFLQGWVAWLVRTTHAARGCLDAVQSTVAPSIFHILNLIVFGYLPGAAVSLLLNIAPLHNLNLLNSIA